jgi:hypothetical protein
MNLFKVLSFLLFLNAIYCAQLSYRDCGPSDRSIKYNAVKIDPYPILYPGIEQMIEQMIKQMIEQMIKQMIKQMINSIFSYLQ